MTPHDRLLKRLRAHCLSKPGTTEELPFDERTVVFKVGGKIFCLLDAFEFQGCGMKCASERVPELRAQYEGVTTGPYLNPKHWNNVYPRPFGDVEWPDFWRWWTTATTSFAGPHPEGKGHHRAGREVRHSWSFVEEIKVMTLCEA